MDRYEKAFNAIERHLEKYGFKDINGDELNLMVQDAAVIELVVGSYLYRYEQRMTKLLREELLRYFAGGLSVAAFCYIAKKLIEENRKEN